MIFPSVYADNKLQPMACLSFPSTLNHQPPSSATSTPPTARRSHQRSLPIQSQHVRSVDKNKNYINYTAVIHKLCRKKQPHVAEKLILKLKSKGIIPDKPTLSALMLCYANNGLLSEAEAIFDEIINSSWTLDVDIVSRLVEICGNTGNTNMISNILCQVKLKDFKLLSRIFRRVIVCFGKRGKIELMEFMLKQMVSMGMNVDSVSGNAYVVYYSVFGSLSEMEVAYGWLKRSRILVEEEAIRAIASAYIREEKFYSLGKFVEDVGLGRRNVGNLLWNVLLLSYAAKFKMKSMQREFVRMVESGFQPDLTTFNIRAMAFSKMLLFWDLHFSLDHMKHVGVVPDLVTYGCVVDAYMERRLARNLDFALSKMNANDSVVALTDPLVFEAMGKGDFHSSSEELLEFARKKRWTYKELIAIYLKKSFRRNQIFWNY